MMGSGHFWLSAPGAAHLASKTCGAAGCTWPCGSKLGRNGGAKSHGRSDVYRRDHDEVESHIQWLAEGDSNIGFFQKKASVWCAKNKITLLEKPDCTTTNDQLEMANMAKEFYSNLYTS